ncbi:MAG TPA: ABC transporter ATP-binding protein [Anaerolineae bacterium]|nr:ABC transporter ATP-binding protein [Anaerolineae bacterium]HMR65331.1 ABC transporter ATP-binding protein [Anaerolineae bacterium]
MLAIENLSVKRGGVQALRGVTLYVAEGEIVSLVGANGAGKSTLLYAIAGALPSSGQIEYQGRLLNGTSADRTARLGIGLVPEGRQIFGTLSVLDNLLLGAYVDYAGHWGQLVGSLGHIANQASIRERLATVYDLFPILEKRSHQDGGSLSGGEQQMLAIGRVLMSAPRLMLVDELSMGLAPNLARQLLGMLGRMRDLGLTILLVEQDARAALKVAERGYVLENGRIVAEGAAGELLNSGRIQEAYLG